MTPLQKVEFEMLKTAVEICDKLGIRYFLVCGSALGAVKYKGFIPWDDDVDIGIFREDYERFLNEAPRLLPKHYFLQNYRTEPQFPFIFSKIRDSRTTYIEKSVSSLQINHGVYIDVFPLDGYPNEPKEQKRLERKKKLYEQLTSLSINRERGLKGRIAVNLLKPFGFHKKTAQIIKRYEKDIAKYRISDSSIICNHGNWQGVLEYAPKEQYGNGTWALFEGLKVRVPKNYDLYLTQKYGAWREELPKEQQIGHHFFELCDLEKPYAYYQKVEK